MVVIVNVIVIIFDTFCLLCYISVDFDIHHGNGVSEAYYDSSSVFTLSFHYYDAATKSFYPGTGSINECGRGDGLYHNLNIPFSSSGTKDNHIIDILEKIKHRLHLLYQPNGIIITLGCDGLQNDPKSKFNLTSDGYVEFVRILLDTFDVPTVILGGGGYNPTQTARTWCKVVAMCCNDYLLDNDIPNHDALVEYGPDYVLNFDEKYYFQNYVNYYNHTKHNQTLFSRFNEKVLQNDLSMVKEKSHSNSTVIIDSESDSLSVDCGDNDNNSNNNNNRSNNSKSPESTQSTNIENKDESKTRENVAKKENVNVSVNDKENSVNLNLKLDEYLKDYMIHLRRKNFGNLRRTLWQVNNKNNFFFGSGSGDRGTYIYNAIKNEQYRWKQECKVSFDTYVQLYNHLIGFEREFIKQNRKLNARLSHDKNDNSQSVNNNRQEKNKTKKSTNKNITKKKLTKFLFKLNKENEKKHERVIMIDKTNDNSDCVHSRGIASPKKERNSVTPRIDDEDNNNDGDSEEEEEDNIEKIDAKPTNELYTSFPQTNDNDNDNDGNSDITNENKNDKEKEKSPNVGCISPRNGNQHNCRSRRRYWYQ